MTGAVGILQGVPAALTFDLPHLIGYAIVAILALSALAIIVEALKPLIDAVAARHAYEGGLGDGYDRDELEAALIVAVERTAFFIEGDFDLETRERIILSIVDDLDLGRLRDRVESVAYARELKAS